MDKKESAGRIFLKLACFGHFRIAGKCMKFKKNLPKKNARNSIQFRLRDATSTTRIANESRGGQIDAVER